MNESTQDMKASELIDALSDEFEIDEERAREVAVERIQKNQMPIYLRTLIGIGSFVSAGFLILFVSVTLGIDESSITLVLGVHLRLLTQLPYQIFIGEIQIKGIETFLEIPK